MLELFCLMPQILQQHKKLAFNSNTSGLLNFNCNVNIKYFGLNSFVKNLEAYLLMKSPA